VDDDLAPLAPAVRAVARHVLGLSADAAEIDDCSAEALRRALEGRARMPSTVGLRPWVLGIARHVCLDALRAKRRARSRGENAAVLDDIADDAPSADQQLELADRARRLRLALDALPEGQRVALLMHAEGHGYREIGQHLSAPVGTICTWISRARRDLALALGHTRVEP
jgi:RNA polymerase sigma factor (sigma-70 family)